MKLEDQLCFLSRATKDIAFDAQQEMARLDKVVTTAKQAADVASKMRLLMVSVDNVVKDWEQVVQGTQPLPEQLMKSLTALWTMQNTIRGDMPQIQFVELQGTRESE